MKQKILPGTDLIVSPFCLGSGSYGDKISKEEAFYQLDTFYEAGGNFVDTANVYCRWATGDNSSELIIGEWLKSRGRKQDMTIATKGAHYAMATPTIPRVSEAEVRADLEESLRSLGLDCIPLYWLHRDDETRPVEEIVDYCAAFVKEGKVLYYGFSNWKQERMKAALRYAKQEGLPGPCAVSNRYSLGYVEKETLNGDATLEITDPNYRKWHERTGMPLIPYTSLCGGYYEKKWKNIPVSPAYENTVNLARYEKMKQWNAEYGWSMMEMTIGYLTGQPFPVIPAAAVSKPAQLKELILAAEFKMPDEMITVLKAMEDR